MKKFLYSSLIAFWVLLASGFLARWWLTNPDAVPRFPEFFWVRLIDLYGSKNADQLAELEVWVALGFSLIFVSLITILSWLLWQRIRKKL